MYLVQSREIMNSTDPRHIIWLYMAWCDAHYGDQIQTTCFLRSATRNHNVSDKEIEQTIDHFVSLGFFFRVPDSDMLKLNVGLAHILEYIEQDLIAK